HSLLEMSTDTQETALAEAQYRALIEMTPLAVWITDTRDRSVYANRYWHEFSGMTAEETAGWGWMNALHPEDVIKVKGEWFGRTTPYEAEMRYRRASDGLHRWELSRARALKAADGRHIHGRRLLVDVQLGN